MPDRLFKAASEVALILRSDDPSSVQDGALERLEAALSGQQGPKVTAVDLANGLRGVAREYGETEDTETVRILLAAAARLEGQQGGTEGRQFRHLKRGTIYTEIGEARLQQASQFGPVEGDAITVYRGEDGQLWARASSEFHDGRFEEIAALKTSEARG